MKLTAINQTAGDLMLIATPQMLKGHVPVSAVGWSHIENRGLAYGPR
jgi:hypothetical protein